MTMGNPNGTTIGILGTGVYLPDTYMTAQDIAAASGLPEDVVEHKLGIRR
jgi:3-oxoacyl-[acyl-carrier-protein] synthase-3